MGFGEAIRTCFSKYAEFEGRAGRPEYWYFALFNVLAGLVFAGIQFEITSIGGQILHGVFDLVVLVPSIAVAARRLHDTDRSGWWQLLLFVPVVGWIILLVWFCQPGMPSGNRFG